MGNYLFFIIRFSFANFLNGNIFTLPIVVSFIVGCIVRINCTKKVTAKKTMIILPVIWLVCEGISTIISSLNIIDLVSLLNISWAFGIIAFSGWVGFTTCHVALKIMNKKTLS